MEKVTMTVEELAALPGVHVGLCLTVRLEKSETTDSGN